MAAIIQAADYHFLGLVCRRPWQETSRLRDSTGKSVPGRLFLHHDLHENASRYSELTNNEDSTWSTFIVHDHVDVVRVILRMSDKPCPSGYATTIAGRWLLAGWTARIPDSTLAGWRIMSFRNIQTRITALMKVSIAVAVPAIPLSRSRVSREARGYKANQDIRL